MSKGEFATKFSPRTRTGKEKKKGQERGRGGAELGLILPNATNAWFSDQFRGLGGNRVRC